VKINFPYVSVSVIVAEELSGLIGSDITDHSKRMSNSIVGPVDVNQAEMSCGLSYQCQADEGGG
jgi:hypothetical protein